MTDKPTIIDRLVSFDRGTLNANKDGITARPRAARTGRWTNWATG